MPARLKDIAIDLGVSIMTVSKALRGEAGIGKATRERVIKRAAEMGYQPNRAARALVTGRSRAVGFMVPDLVHPFFSQVARGLSRVLQSRNYGLVIASSDEDLERERLGIEVMLSQRVDALIVASVQPKALLDSRPGLAEAKPGNMPVVLIDRAVSGMRAPFVGNDDRAIGLLATEHLIHQGWKRIAHIRGGATSPSVQRLAGYREALARHKLPWRPGLVVEAASPDRDGLGSGRAAMDLLLAQVPRPDAVFCFNDPVACGALAAIMDAGLKIPDDVAVVGCGNFLHNDLLAVPLSSVDQGADEIGIRAGELVLDLLSGSKPRKPQSILIPPHLVARRSSAGAARTTATASAQKTGTKTGTKTGKETARRRPSPKKSQRA